MDFRIVRLWKSLAFKRAIICALSLMIALSVSGCITKPRSQPEISNLKEAPQKASWFNRAQKSLFKFFPKKKRPPKADQPVFVGTIAMVSEQDHFVLVDITTFSNISPDTEVVSISDGVTRARLRISSEKKHPFVIADIIDGFPTVGDRVVQLND